MELLIKYLKKNVMQKKLLSLLIIISIIFTSALFFVANGAQSTTRKISTEVKRKYVGSSDIVVESNSESPLEFFGISDIEKYEKLFSYQVNVIEKQSTYVAENKDVVNLAVRGIDYDKVGIMNNFILEKQKNLKPFTKNKVIISTIFSDKYNLKLGESIQVYINDSVENLEIVGIAKPVGPFMDDGEMTFILVPYEFLSSKLQTNSEPNKVYIKLKNQNEKTKVIKMLSDEESLKKYVVKESISMAEIESDVKQRTDPYKLIVIVVGVLCVFIIYSCFNVILAERMPTIGTLRSLGATKKKTNFLLIMETITYGLIGGLGGCLVGVYLLKIVLKISLPTNLKNANVTIDYSYLLLIGTIILSILVSVISSLIPIKKVSRMSIKNVLFNDTIKFARYKKWKGIIGLIMIFTSVIIPQYVNGNISIVINLICIILPVVGTILVIPIIVNLCIDLLSKVSSYLKGNILITALKNLKNNKINTNSISLLSISIGCFLIINTLSYSVNLEMKDLFRNNASFDAIMITKIKDSKSLEEYVNSLSDINGTYATYTLSNVGVVDTNTQIGKIHGVDEKKFSKYWDVNIVGNKESKLKELSDGRNILLSNLLIEKLNVKIGSYITLNTISGNKEYKVIGSFVSYNSGGSYALISEENLKKDMQDNYYLELCIDCKYPEKVVEQLKDYYLDSKSYIYTMDNFEEMNYESYKSLFVILKVFSIVCLVISIFSIINNLIIAFIQRKKEFAMLISIGMSRRQLLRMVIFEGIICGGIGGLAGISCTTLMLKVLPYFMMSINQVTPIHFSSSLCLYAMLASIGITLIASISSMINVYKLNVVSVIKYQ